MVVKEKISSDDMNHTLANIRIHTDMATAVKGMDLVVEAATENIQVKD